MLPREASSGLPKTFEARLYAQLRGDALDPDAPIEFLVPVVDAPLLVIERDSPKARRLQRLLDGGGELQVLIKNAIEVLDAGLPQLRGRATPQSGANQWHSIRMLVSEVGQKSNGAPVGSTGVTRLG